MIKNVLYLELSVHTIHIKIWMINFKAIDKEFNPTLTNIPFHISQTLPLSSHLWLIYKHEIILDLENCQKIYWTILITNLKNYFDISVNFETFWKFQD